MISKACLALCAALALTPGCSTASPVQTINVTMKNNASFQFPTQTGEVSQVSIVIQPGHSSVSNVHLDNNVATYFYQPETGYVGTDTAEIVVTSASTGTGPGEEIQRVHFNFVISAP